MRRLVLDIENLLAITGGENDDASPSPDRLRTAVQTYRNMGFEIVISCSTAMTPTEAGSATAVGGIPPALLAQLGELWELYDEVYFGRPHCVPDGFVLDDKAVTPEEFLEHDYSELRKLVNEQEEG